MKGGQNVFFGCGNAVFDIKNFAAVGNFFQQNIAPDPSRAARGRGKRFAPFDHIADKKVFGDKQQILYGVIRVSHKEKVRIVAAGQAVDHRIVCAVRDFASEAVSFAFLFELFAAGGAEKIGDGAVVFVMSQPFPASGAERVFDGPFFGQYTDFLGFAFVIGG